VKDRSATRPSVTGPRSPPPALAGALVLLAWFVANEQRARNPLVPLAIFRNRNVSGANVAMAAVYAGNLGMFFLITLPPAPAAGPAGDAGSASA
jgi:hypothetical protein